MLARVGTPFGQDGSSKAERGTQCGCPGSESLVLKMSASSRVMPEKYHQRCSELCRTTHPSNDHSGLPSTSKTASAPIRSAGATLCASHTVKGISCGGGDKARHT